ncbi:MAG: CPBP family intramembrane glutamic endopeptidase [Salinivirgaceae bacterium]|nr:CPBP family intramembrane glutamic endopeptidase [Salinivirgaceae bacterium]
MEKNKSKYLIYFLIIGIVFWFVGFVYNLHYYINTGEFYTDILQQPLFERLLQFSPFTILFLTIVIAPLFEEVVFRLWTKLNSLALIISYFGLVFFTHSFFKTIWLTIIAIVVFGYFLFFLKKEKIRLPSLIMLTSVVFGFIHLANFNSGSFSFLGVLSLVGFGMVLSYISLRFGFKYAVLVHSFNNCLAILPMLFLSQNSILSFSGESYNAQQTVVNLFSFGEELNYQNQDSILVIAGLPQMASALSPFTPDVFYVAEISSLNKYKLIVRKKNSTIIDKEALLSDFLIKNNISVDTMLVKGVLFSALDTSFLKSVSPEKSFIMNVVSLVSTLRARNKLPIVLDEYTPNIVFNMGMPFLELENFEDIKAYLIEKYRILIVKDSNYVAKKIIYSVPSSN